MIESETIENASTADVAENLSRAAVSNFDVDAAYSPNWKTAARKHCRSSVEERCATERNASAQRTSARRRRPARISQPLLDEVEKLGAELEGRRRRACLGTVQARLGVIIELGLPNLLHDSSVPDGRDEADNLKKCARWG